MKVTKQLIAAMIAVAPMAAALADEFNGGDRAVQSVSVATRAEVRNELAQFKASGVNPWRTDYNPLVQFKSQRSRAQTVSDFLRDRDLVDLNTAEDSGSFNLILVSRPAGLQMAQAV